MKVLKVEQREDKRMYLEIEVDSEKFEAAMEKSYKKNVKKINIPGFRKGHAPRKIIEKYYTEAVFYDDAINFVIPDAYDEAVAEAKIDPVEMPEVDIVKLEKGENFVFSALVTVRPEVKLGDYKGITAEKQGNNVTDEDIDAEIKKMQDNAARVTTAEEGVCEIGDKVDLDFDGYVDGEAFDGGKGENYELTLGSGQFIPGFEEQIIGHKTGDEFDVNVTFPTEYTPELAGKDAVFKVVLHEIKMKELPALDDDFAKDVDDEVDTLAELKKKIKTELSEKKKEDVERNFESAVLEKVVDLVEGEIPEVMYDNKLEDDVKDYENRLAQQGIPLDTYLQYMGMDRDKFKESMRDNAVKQVKLQLAVEKIAELEKIEATDEEAEAQLKEMADMYQLDVEQVKKWVNIEDVKKDVVGKKTVDFLVANAKAIVAEKPKKTTKKAAAKKEEEKPADAE